MMQNSTIFVYLYYVIDYEGLENCVKFPILKNLTRWSKKHVSYQFNDQLVTASYISSIQLAVFYSRVSY